MKLFTKENGDEGDDSPSIRGEFYLNEAFTGNWSHFNVNNLLNAAPRKDENTHAYSG